MASYHGHAHSEPAKMEQIITEFFAKSLHIILESRCPYVSSRNYSGEQVLFSPSPSSSSSSSSSFRPRDKWFNLALRDCPAALENIDFWRQSNLEPMIVDVILVQRPTDWDPLNFSPRTGHVQNSYGSDNDEFWPEGKSEKIIERWVLQYESKKDNKTVGSSSGNKRSSCPSSHALYKKSILMLRSLYATVRLLPAYKLFRDLISTARIRLYNLGHRVSSFVEPFTRREEADMQRFVFTPVETSCGRLCLSVLYRTSVTDVTSEPSTPISPQFIPEYVGSPMAEPLRRLPSISPSSSPFGRRHSWSYGLCKASPPSPTHSESHVKKHTRNFPCPRALPRLSHDETVAVHVKKSSYDEYWPSPVFSPSPSPSPPAHVRDGHLCKALLRCESAPVSIPVSRLSTVPSVPSKLLMPPSPPMKETRLTISKKAIDSDKFFSFGKDEQGKMMVMKSSFNSSPCKSFSRSSSRLSFQDDCIDSEFSGPFIVDDDDIVDPGSRPISFNPCGPHEPKGVKKSQDAAAVGALVRMLKKAPPLRQDISLTMQNHVGPALQNDNNSAGNKNSSSSTFSNLASKTTADALDELRGYREIKDLLLKHGKISQP
ncbi:autophagy-related protein 13 [Striga asiatica]|uniref:Autophagy-related protein 13 n=1 Tax=Striga asiatica TaxID=4170 RepID=A0A5A7P9U2_STRAF|nr:autophagy-related protein 13 [Striga asiatica]